MNLGHLLPTPYPLTELHNHFKGVLTNIKCYAVIQYIARILSRKFPLEMLKPSERLHANWVIQSIRQLVHSILLKFKNRVFNYHNSET